MDLGICKYKPDAGPLARRLRASWAHWFADLSGGDLPDDTALFASCAEHGLRPVPNLRTSIAALRRFGAEGGMDGAIQWYSDCILRYCDTYPVRDIEVWGDADIAFIAGGKANPLDYGRVLTAVYWRVKSARPDVTIWSARPCRTPTSASMWWAYSRARRTTRRPCGRSARNANL